MRLDQVPARSSENGLVHVIIDTPAGSANKYKFDETPGLFKVSRVLPAGLAFPHDFGSVPQTCAADGIRWMCWSWGYRRRFRGV